MLNRLIIKNVALIDSATIEFSEGLNVLSGETGSGKSVILDSINFVLGAKADKSMIRYGERECSVRAEFTVDEDSSAYGLLKDMDIETDGTLTVSRRFNVEGRGAIRINGVAATAAMLKRLTSELVDVHGQSEHFFLLDEANQLKVIDAYAGAAIFQASAELAEVLKKLRVERERLQSLGGDPQERARRADILRFQIDEIDAAELKEDEEDALIQRRTFLANAEKIENALAEASAAISDSAIDSLNTALRRMRSVSQYEKAYDELCERIDSVISEVDDILATVEDFSSGLDYDASELVKIEDRLDTIKLLRRKYGKDYAAIVAFRDAAEAEYELLTHCDEEFERISKKIEKQSKIAISLCRKLTEIRKKAADEFAKKVVTELKTLHIKNANFTVSFNEYDDEAATYASAKGADSVSFLFSANAGEPLKPMNKIISGGEMSRFMLSIKTQSSDVNGISTYIFDEIDAGISGVTAKVVAEKFAKIAKTKQIIAVSHLAQIAAMSDCELLISKHEEAGKTLTRVRKVEGKDRLSEIIRLIGGKADSEHAILHAKELLAECEEYKNSLN